MSLNPLNILLPTPPSSHPTQFRRGRITGLDPLRVNLDRDEPSVELECTTLIKPAVGLRVMVLLFEGRTTIIGASKGLDVPEPTPPYVPPPDPSWTNYSPVLMSTGANPSGYSSVGRYLAVGDICHIEMQVTFPGNWTGYGTGIYQMSLPRTPAGYSGSMRGVLNGVALLGGGEYQVTATIESNVPVMTRVRRLLNNTYGNLTADNHGVDLRGGRIIINGSYRAVN